MENHHAINGKIHYKWPFLIAMLVYQRVPIVIVGFPVFPMFLFTEESTTDAPCLQHSAFAS